MGNGIVPVDSRRAFIVNACSLALLSLTRRVRAQISRLRFRPLARATVVPLEQIRTRWVPRPFTADGVTLSTAANANQPIRIAGMLVRTASDGAERPEQFAAVSVRCPHELCDVDYVADPRRLPPEVLDEIKRPVTDPVFVCPCHNSTFTVDGERLAGPAPRGLYRFRVTSVTGVAVEIGEVEEDALIFVE